MTNLILINGDNLIFVLIMNIEINNFTSYNNFLIKTVESSSLIYIVNVKIINSFSLEYN